MIRGLYAVTVGAISVINPGAITIMGPLGYMYITDQGGSRHS